MSQTQTASFDNYAQQYDGHFTYSPIGILQRQAVDDYLLPLLNGEHDVLEINCGTGYDAHKISGYVKSVLATDASLKMIEQCILRNTLTENVVFKVTRIQDLFDEIKNANFIFSNFGGLNCISPTELEDFAKRCGNLSPQKTELFFVIMGRKCIWERIYFTLKGKSERAKRRFSKDAVKANIDGSEFNTWYYSPNEILELFDKNFKVECISGVGLFVPPSYLNPFFLNKKLLLKLFNVFDKVICKFKWTANYSDHYIIHLKKIN